MSETSLDFKTLSPFPVGGKLSNSIRQLWKQHHFLLQFSFYQAYSYIEESMHWYFLFNNFVILLFGNIGIWSGWQGVWLKWHSPEVQLSQELRLSLSSSCCPKSFSCFPIFLVVQILHLCFTGTERQTFIYLSWFAL